MASKAGLGQTPATTDARRTQKFYRGSPGRPWLIGAVVIPLLIAAIGYGAFERPQSVTDLCRRKLPQQVGRRDRPVCCRH